LIRAVSLLPGTPLFQLVLLLQLEVPFAIQVRVAIRTTFFCCAAVS
jgi:hypothetical protein